MTQTVLLASQPERVERLRAQLSGEPAAVGATSNAREGSRAARRARRLALSPAANLLYGMTLRAAARSEQNEKLTDLEEQLVGVLRLTGASDGEIGEFGRVFQEQATARGAGALFTQEVTGRPLSEGFSFDDLAAVLPALAPEITDQPNFRTVRVDDLADGQPLDTSEAAALRNEFGGGVIVFLTEDDQAGFGTNPVPLTARVEYNKFYAEARAHDSIFDPKNEIYWCSGAGSDQSKTDYMSGVFGGVDTGQWRHFGDGSHFFNGQIKNALTGNIQCWEEDDSGTGFITELRGAMRDIKEWAFKTSEKLENQNEEYNGSSAFLSLVGLVAALIDAILGWLINNDDFIQDIDVAFSSAALFAMSKRPVDHNSIRFQGDGGAKMILYLNVVMPQGPAFPLHQRILVPNAASWTQPTTPPGLTSGSPVALASHRGALHALFRAPGADHLLHATLTGTTWSTPVHFPYAASHKAPALASDGTRLHAIHIGGDGLIYHNWLTNQSWGAFTTIHASKASTAPTLAFHDGKLHALYAGLDKALYHNSYANGVWSSTTKLTRWIDASGGGSQMVPVVTEHAPSAVSYGGALQVLYRDAAITPGSINHLTLPAGGGLWQHRATDAGWRSRYGVALGVLETKMWCYFVLPSGQHRYAAFTTRWEDMRITGSASVDEPALANHAGALHALYRN